MEAKIKGPVYAKVCNTDDPDKMGRVKVSFHFCGDPVESNWLDVMSTYGGSFFVPEVGDQVVVAFFNGSPSSGVVIGNVWSDSQKPPECGLGGKEFNEDGKNSSRYLRTRGGNRVAFDDTPGNQKLQFVNQQSINKIELLAKGKKIEVNSKNRVVVKSKKAVKIKADKGTFTFEKDLKIEAKEIKIQTDGNLKIEASQLVDIAGKTVKMN